MSYCDHIVLKDINMTCDIFYDIAINEYNKLSDFTFENMVIKAGNGKYDKSIVKGIVFKNVVVNDEVID